MTRLGAVVAYTLTLATVLTIGAALTVAAALLPGLIPIYILGVVVGCVTIHAHRGGTL